MKYLVLTSTFLSLPFYALTTYGGDTAVSTVSEAQKIEIIVDSYSFEPDRITVT
jgi:hypothetical protein